MKLDPKQFREGAYRFQVEFEGSGIPRLVRSRGVSAGISLDNERSGYEQDYRYELRELIAESESGPIFAAFEHNCRREVALKLCCSQVATDEILAEFAREAQIAARVEHPGVLPVYELGLDEVGNAFIAMKRIHGRTLQQILSDIKAGHHKAVQRYPLDRLLQIFAQVCEAIEYAHSQGIVHCDLCPENILIGKYNEVRVMRWRDAFLLDGGPNQPGGNRHNPNAPDEHPVAQALDPSKVSMAEWAGAQQDDKAHSPVNPLRFACLAPEQTAIENASCGRASDIYALGAILYTILTLRPPVKGVNKSEVLRSILAHRITPISGINAESQRARKGRRGVELAHCPNGEVPAALAAIALKALTSNPTDRYDSARVLRERVAGWERERDRKADRTSFLSDWLRFGKRHRRVRLLALVTLPIVVGALFAVNAALVGVLRAAEERRQESTEALTELTRERDALDLRRGYGRSMELPEEQAYWVLAQEALKEGELSVDASIARAQLAIAMGNMDEVRNLLGSVFEAVDDRRTYQHACDLYVASSATRGPPKPISFMPQRAKAGPSEDEYGQVRVAWNADDFEMTWRQLKIELERLNPALSLPDDALTVEDGVVSFSAVNEINLHDIRPLADLPISRLELAGTGVEDLTPLAGMPLVSASFFESVAVRDLTPLAGLPLRSLDISQTLVSDLTPLAGLPLTELFLDGAPVLSLAVLQGMKLTSLSASDTRIRSLKPLAGMSLTSLGVSRTQIASLAPLAGMPLEALALSQTLVGDVSPLKGMPLKVLMLNDTLVADLLPLKTLTSKSLSLNLSNTQIRSIEALAGLPLKQVYLQGCSRVKSVAPLAFCVTLQHLTMPPDAAGEEYLKDLPKLHTITDERGVRYSRKEFFE